MIDSLEEIDAIGHRVVHGGEIFKESAVIDEKVMQQISECGEFAPLHNPAAVLGMEACKNVMPGKPMVAVFDTTFHQTMQKDKYIYPIPYEFYKKYGVRKYGAHGTSHMYVSQRLAEIENKNIEDLKPLLKTEILSGYYTDSSLFRSDIYTIADFYGVSDEYIIGGPEFEEQTYGNPLDEIAQKFLNVFLELNEDNRDIIIGDMKKLLKEQRREEALPTKMIHKQAK